MASDILKLKQLAQELSVLYVEDEIEISKNIAIYLKKLFHNVYIASNGKEGLSVYAKKQPDLVITDINMPEMDGFEMSENIRKKNPEQNILVISAYTDVENFTRFISLGVDGYILKPVSYEQLNTMLYKVVYKINQFRENQHYKESLEEMVEEKTKEVKKLEHERANNYKKTLFALVKMIEDRDSYTGGHSVRVAKYARLIAKEMGFDNSTCENIHKAGILHDIGKVAIPDNILLKPGLLDNIEFTLIKEHVNMGVKILKKVPMFEKLVLFIEAHHERLDGSGYPKGLKGREIPIEAQVLAICDTFDAMTTSRIYKSRKTIEEAIEEIKTLSGKHFLKEIVDVAEIVFKTITIDEGISQLPKTALEKERFAYFYKDQSTQSYNSTYLDLVLLQNSYEIKYHYLYLIEIDKLKYFYQQYGWQAGDAYLKNIYENLSKIYSNEMIFRVFNDDFVLLSKKELKIEEQKLENLMLKDDITFKIRKFNIKEDEIFSLHDIERLQ